MFLKLLYRRSQPVVGSTVKNEELKLITDFFRFLVKKHVLPKHESFWSSTDNEPDKKW